MWVFTHIQYPFKSYSFYFSTEEAWCTSYSSEPVCTPNVQYGWLTTPGYEVSKSLRCMKAHIHCTFLLGWVHMSGSRNQNKSCKSPDTVELDPFLPVVVVKTGITLPLSFFLMHEKSCSYKNRCVYIAENEDFSLCSLLASLIYICLKPSGFQTGLLISSAVFPSVYVTRTFHVAVLVDDQGVRGHAVSLRFSLHIIIFSLSWE